jgi:cystathionine beta-synthase
MYDYGFLDPPSDEPVVAAVLAYKHAGAGRANGAGRSGGNGRGRHPATARGDATAGGNDRAAAPELVHVHPDETVGAAISYLREYNVSQMPVVRHEPPLRAAEVAGAVLERELLAAVFTDRAAIDAPVAAHMSAPLPTIGSGEPLSTLVEALGGNDPAVLVLDSGNPVGILTRADLLSFLAAR